MCGIFGYYDLRGKRLTNDILEKMGDLISYRGPDGRGIYHDPVSALAVGNQRLAILDVEHGQQPFASDDNRIVVVQNGEIFNHVEIASQLRKLGYLCKTHCDTEVILGLYITQGIEGLKQLNGMFAIAIWDAEKRKLILYRDRVGEKPLYYSFVDGRLIFASEIKSILEASPNKRICQEAVEQFFSFNYVPAPLTMFEGIYHVEPGTYLEINSNGIESTSWWDCFGVEEKEQSEADWIAQFNSCLDDSVRIRLRSDVPFGAFLSGGVDSSTVVGLMAKHMELPVKTYSIGFTDPKYDESLYAKEAAERFGTEHSCEIVHPDMLGMWSTAIYHCDQPHGDVSFMPTLKVAQLAARDVKMVLTGDGADELFAGYDKYANFFSNTKVGEVDTLSFQAAYSKNISLFTNDNLASLCSFELTTPDVVNKRLAPLFSQASSYDKINQALYIDSKLLLSGNNLVKPDRMGMAASIENRAPFLDYRMIELAFSMPGAMKLNGGQTKYIYKKAVEELIGKNLAYRKKQMFTVPVGEWFRKEMYPLCRDLLLGERARSRGFFNYDFVRDLLENHVSGNQNNTREIRALMAFELWAQRFID